MADPASKASNPLDYEAPEPGKKPNRVLAIIGFAFSCACMVVLALSIFSPGIGQSRPRADRAKCQSNMHQIGLAILLYQNDYGGAYPDTLDQLLEESITPNVFICPASNDVASTGATTQAVAADFLKGGHLSYIYLGKGLTAKTVTYDTVVLYEPMADHGSGMNMLFGDGHAEWINGVTATKVLSAVKSGVHQVKLNTLTGTVTTAPATNP